MAADDDIITIPAIDIQHNTAQARGVDHIIAGTGVEDDFFDTGIGLVPTVKLDVDHTALARKDESFIAIGGIEVLTQPRAAAGIDREGVAQLDGQHRLYLGCIVFEVKQLDLEQRCFKERNADRANQRNTDRQLNEHIQCEVGVHLHIEQVLEAATLVGIHGGNLAATDAPIADPVDLGHKASVVFGEHLSGDVLQIDTRVEIDHATATAGDGPQANRKFQTDRGADVKLVFFLASSAWHDLAVSELRQREVVHKEAIEGIDRVAGVERFAHAEGVKAKGQVGKGLELGNGIEREQHGPDRHLGQWHPLVKLDTQQRQLVAEQHGIAARENRLPVVDALDVLEHLEARALWTAGAAGGLGCQVVEFALQIGQ